VSGRHRKTVRGLRVLSGVLYLMVASLGICATPGEQSHYLKSNLHRPRVIVFVHGVLGKPLETWTARNGAYWPTLMSHDINFQLSDIFVASYSTFKTAKSFTTQSIDEQVSVVWDQLTAENVWADHREVVFLCHSLGGLVVERMLILHPELGTHVPFIVSFGTPHQGSFLARLAGLVGIGGTLVKNLSNEDDNEYLERLDSDWRAAASLGAVRRFCAFEGQDTPLPDQFGGSRIGSVRVVSYFSATYDCDTSTAVVEILANHYDIVKPVGKNSVSYMFFKQVYQNNPVTEIRLVQRKESTPELTVDCERTNSSQDLQVAVALDPKLQERVTKVVAALVDSSNIKDVNPNPPQVTKFENGIVHISYGFNGLDRSFGNCPGGGHAKVQVTFDVEQRVPLLDADSVGDSAGVR
jgi:pimeloyl-ACP methyl ester carboxylesterase